MTNEYTQNNLYKFYSSYYIKQSPNNSYGVVSHYCFFIILSQ